MAVRHRSVGVIGHVDHGKSALVRALTGCDTDRLKEEKQRGISIALGFAHLETPAGTVDLIDMPGHERFVRTMIAGATGIDAVLLVIAANEGIQPQTVEHVDIAALLGIRQALLVVAKADLASADDVARMLREGVRLLGARGIDVVAALSASTVTGEGVEPLRDALVALIAATPDARGGADGNIFLPIDRAFSVAGHGPVVTGTLRGAPLGRVDTLELFPASMPVRIRNVQVHGEDVRSANAGERVAVNLRDVKIGELGRGMALAAPGSLSESRWLTVTLRATEGAAPIANGLRVRVLAATDEFDARIRLLDSDRLEPGQSALAQLHCEAPVFLPAREHVVVRIASPAQTIAGGRILEPVTKRRRRHDPQILERLAELRDLPAATFLACELERQGARGASSNELARLLALRADRLNAMLEGFPVRVTRRGMIFRTEDIDRVTVQVKGLLDRTTAGLSRKQLLSALPGTRGALLDEALRDLTVDAQVVRTGAQYHSPHSDHVARRDEGEAAARMTLLSMLQAGGLTPPNPGAMLTDAETKRAAERLLREGLIVRAVDQAKGREMLFHRDAVDEAKDRLRPHLDEGRGMLVTEIGSALGISRKFTMPLVHYLDAVRFTRRDKDRRYADIASNIPSPTALLCDAGE